MPEIKQKARRKAHDAYYTDPKLALAICKTLHPLIPDAHDGRFRILEPSAGAGAFVEASRHVWGPDTFVAAIDPHPHKVLKRKLGPTGVLHKMTFERYVELRTRPEADTHLGEVQFDLGVGNPPYNLAELHTQLARSMCRWVGFLFRFSFLGSQGRAERVFAKRGLRYFIPITPRPSFTGDGSDNSEYAVFVFQQNYTGFAEVLDHLWWEQS